MGNIFLQFERLWGNLLSLGAKRLAVLGLVGISVFGLIGAAGYLLSRPAQEVLYAGLDRQDVARVSMALKEANIGFDISSDGNTVYVRYGQSAQARMMLAEKGLPHGASAGYELFDKLGSLGLTSFMQEVTRLRAIEGELARTIQLIRGIKAARVHIVMADEGSFRRVRQPASASVIIRTESVSDSISASAIRHLVAAAVPGMTPDLVTVLNSDGVLLTTNEEGAEAGPSRMRNLEKTVSQEIQERITRTLVPYLGLKNFQVSVAARVNTDKRQVNETIYNPESRVERSVRVTKESQTSQNATSQGATSVERNLPQDKAKSDGKQSNEENQKKEELTNYEVSSKNITTVSAGYALDTMSIAVLVNRSGVAASLGDKATPETVTAQIAEIEKIVASASGFRKERGDVLRVSAVEFNAGSQEIDPVAGLSIVEQLVRQSGALINAGAFILIALLLIWFGLRPATRALLNVPGPEEVPSLSKEITTADFGNKAIAADPVGYTAQAEQSLIEDISSLPRRKAQRRLEQIVQLDEVQAAAILKQWIHQAEGA